MKRKSRLKIIIPILLAVAAAAVGCYFWLTSGTRGEPVKVFAFQNLGMTEYWGDNQESYGFVQTDKVQTVFLSNTQTVTEILVSQGDQVKKGDVLMTFDTTLSDLALEKKRLSVEKLKLQLEDAKAELKRIRNLKPMVIPEPSDEEVDTEKGVALKGPYQISTQAAYDGSSQAKALICWLGSSTAVNDEIFQALLEQAELFQNRNAGILIPSSASAPLEPLADDPPAGDPPAGDPPAEDPPAGDPPDQPEDSGGSEGNEGGEGGGSEGGESGGNEGGEGGSTPEPPEPEPIVVERFYVVFKVTSGNMSLGTRQVWQGIQVIKSGSGFKFKFFDASSVPDHTLAPDESAPDIPQIDFGSGYTASQIAQMRSQQEKVIKDLEFQIKMADAEYKIMLTEVNDGNVYAEVDGTVVSVLTEEEATASGQPLLKVSGGGGFHVEGAISELDRDSIIIGSEVTVNDWRSGMVYSGTIESIGDYPSSQNSWNGMGNPTATYYPLTVFVAESADLQSGSYVSITYSSGGSQNGIYLENPFLRTENGRSYVYIKGSDGKLEQRFVTVGKSLWGSYTEILSGITAEDFLAFPYGPTVKPGAPAVEAEIRELYE